MSSPAIIRSMREAVALHQAGKLPQAEAIYRRVLQQEPNNPDALHLLGLVAHQVGQNAPAVDLIARAIAIKSSAPEFYVNYAQALRGLARHEDAVAALKRAIQLDPKLPEAHMNLGTLLKDLNRLDEAIAALTKATQLRPNYAEAFNNLGNALAARGDGPEAIAAFQKAIELNPRSADAYVNLGNVLQRAKKLDEAVTACQRALELKPDLAPAHNNLGNALYEQGLTAEALEEYRKTAELQPDKPDSQAKLVVALNDSTTASPREIFEAHVRWAERFAEPLTRAAAPHGNDRSPDRRLRIGYVSPDFRRHSVSFFIEPILANHDHSQFEITGYSNLPRGDDVTDRLKSYCDRWRDIFPMSDADVAELIRRDEIDILIDLAGHTIPSRLLVFARKPAPVQVTYLGYPNTTGLRAMDYRLTDAQADPVGQTDAFHTEKLIRLPNGFLCYQPPTDAPDVADPPMLRNGFVTFGSFNRISKVGPDAVALWAKLMHAAPWSKMLLKSPGLGSAGSRRRMTEEFAKHGIASARLTLADIDPSMRAHLDRYSEIDIALDPFPYNGTTTTCEALWMGVPVISLIGQTHVSRVGFSVLSAVGHSRFAAQDHADFVTLAIELGSNAAELTRLRRDLRPMMNQSALTDAPGQTRAVESTFRGLWKEGCLP